MFRETLLESATSRRNSKRWPMALAFTAELFVAALLVIIPLLSTGVISVSAHVPQLVALKSVDLANEPRTSQTNSSRGALAQRHSFVTLSNTSADMLRFGPARPVCCGDDTAPNPNIGGNQELPDSLLPGGNERPPAQPRLQRVRISVVSEGQLIAKVEPVYPPIAILTHTQGEVRLHAIIAKDGSIQSLSVMSGAATSPILAKAAIDAVRQWRYKPYYLNGEPVEVETFITVNFKKTNE